MPPCYPCCHAHKPCHHHHPSPPCRSTNTLVLERPLPYNISTSWGRNIYVYAWAYTMTQVGVEDLGLEFKLDPYPKHLQEKVGSGGVGWDGQQGHSGQCWCMYMCECVTARLFSCISTFLSTHSCIAMTPTCALHFRF